MIKTVGLLKARPDLTREEFIRHYETAHAPMAVRLFPMFKAYRRNFRPEEGWSEAPFHVITEIEFEDQAAYDAFRKKIAEPEVMQEVREDEDRFMVRQPGQGFLVELHESKLR